MEFANSYDIAIRDFFLRPMSDVLANRSQRRASEIAKANSASPLALSVAIGALRPSGLYNVRPVFCRTSFVAGATEQHGLATKTTSNLPPLVAHPP